MLLSRSPSRRTDRPPGLHGWLVAVALAGIVVLGLTAPGAVKHLEHATPAVWLLFAFVLAGELLPIKLPGHEEEVTTSAPFMYALMVACGTPVAIAAQAVSSAIADVRLGKAPLAIAFNVGQCTLSLAAAGVVLDALRTVREDAPSFAFGASDLVVLGAVGLTFFVANNALAGTAGALAHREPILRYLASDWRFQVVMAALVVGFAPLVVAVAAHDVLLVPLLLLPLISLHRGTRAARLSEHQASHDALTGLPNRKLFRVRAERALSHARRADRMVAVLVMDLDRFKEVNDTLGHHHGDLLLQAIAVRLREELRPSDLIARFGGDEFAVLLEDLGSVDEAEAVARRLLDALEAPFEVGGIVLDSGASIGIVCAPLHGDDVDTLIQHGDVAMYIAKAGHFGWALYEPDRDSNSVDRLSLAGELRRAFDNDELVLHYQPQIDLATGRVCGVEALVRWQHPERGLLSPDAFVPLAEHTGLIRPLTLRTLELALAQAGELRRSGLALVMSVNASSRDVLDPVLFEKVDHLLAVHDVPAAGLSIEITESTLMADPRRARTVLERFSARGVRIAVDDFGTGYSSLGYLKNLPIDDVKIDKSFVLGMSDDRSDAAIVASTIDLARNLGMQTVAEGVEDEDAYDLLRRLGCDVAQGYWMSRPLPPDALRAWLAGREELELAT